MKWRDPYAERLVSQPHHKIEDHGSLIWKHANYYIKIIFKNMKLINIIKQSIINKYIHFERDWLISFYENGKKLENRIKWHADAEWLATLPIDKTDQKNYKWERKR